MTHFLLDTNIVSEFTKPVRSPQLLAWLGDQDDEDLFISAFSIAEIRRGILILPAGKRRRELERWFEGPDGPSTLFSGRVLPFDEPSAMIWAELMAEGQARGRPRSAVDTIIGAIAVAHRCVLITNNERDFSGVGTFNPMKSQRD